MLQMGWTWEFGVGSFQMEMSHASLGITKNTSIHNILKLAYYVTHRSLKKKIN